MRKIIVYLDTITKMKTSGIKKGQMEEKKKLYGLQTLSLFF
jgi:hypothetical protein